MAEKTLTMTLKLSPELKAKIDQIQADCEAQIEKARARGVLTLTEVEAQVIDLLAKRLDSPPGSVPSAEDLCKAILRRDASLAGIR